MKSTKYLLVGGGLASARAIEAIRSLDRRGHIVLVTDEPHLPYDRPPLSKELISGKLRPQDIRCHSPFFYIKHRVKVVRSTKVESIETGGGPRTAIIVTSRKTTRRKDRAADGLYAADRRRRVRKLQFEKCLIATGGAARFLPLPGADLSGVFTLRSVDDAMSIRDAALAAIAAPGGSASGGRARAVVVGAGFIGLELAASLRTIGLEVTVIEQAPQVWPLVADQRVARHMQAVEEEHGVEFLLGERVAEIRVRSEPLTGGSHRPRAGSVATVTGSVIECDLVCIAAGIEPNTAVALMSGLHVTDRKDAGDEGAAGGIVVDSTLKAELADGSPAEGIYAAGDVANVPDPWFGVRRRVEHYGQAEYTGLLAGTNMAGGNRTYDFLTYLWTDLFDVHIEGAGYLRQSDSVLLRGDPATGSFIALHVSQGQLIGFMAINRQEREFGPLRMLIQRKTDLSDHIAELQDPEFDTAGLIDQTTEKR